MRVCPTCAEENQDKAKFCSECATPLIDASPPGEERKTVTVLFCDLVGFTARSDRADPEEVRATIVPYHRLLRQEIERFGGTVEKFIGDAVMAVFGAPVAHEDDAERAIRAALRILEVLGEDGAEESLSVRIGVNTGEAVVTLGAHPEQGEAIVTGDVVNTASRLQGAAPVDAIVVGEATFESTAHLFEYEELAPVTVKGKHEPIRIWRPVAPRSRFGVDLQDVDATAFVGREDELAILTSALRRAIRSESCQLVTIIGEPGVGKSRLVSELLRHVDEMDELISWRQGRCLPYGEGITFWALGEIVKAHCGILESDDPAEAAEKLEIALRPIVHDDDRPWVAARLKPLVGLETEASGEVAQTELFQAWRAFVEAVAATGPLVVVFEDLHWADEALLGFIDHLGEFSLSAPILVVSTARPELFETHAEWGAGQRNSSTVSLTPLTESETSVLIAGLLSNAVLPAEIHEVVLERSGGNPLYAEEFVRMLKDRGLLERSGRSWTLAKDQEIPLPATVQALIAARIDTLPADRKAFLHDASVIGKVFWPGAVAAIGSADELAVREGLHDLSRKELIRPSRTSSVKGQPEYSFWHLLVRDVAYSQIPKSIRGAKHVSAARWIENMSGDRAADHAEVLSHHYAQALQLDGEGVDERLARRQAASFASIAARRAAALDVAKSVTLYERAIQLGPKGEPERIGMDIELAGALQSGGQLDRARELLEGSLAALDHGDIELRTEAMLSLARVLSYREGASASRSLVEDAIALLEAVGPRPALALAYAELAAQFGLEGSAEGALWAEKALALADQFDLRTARVNALIARGLARFFAGDPAAMADYRKAIEIGQREGLGRPVVLAFNNIATMALSLEGPRSAARLCREAIETCEKRGFAEFYLSLRSCALAATYESGEWDAALSESEADLEEAQARHDFWTLSEIGAFRARILAARGLEHHAAMYLESARSLGYPEGLVLNLTASATSSFMSGDEGRSRALTREVLLNDLIGNSADHVAELARVACASGDAELLAGFLEKAPRVLTRHRLGHTSAAALLAETHGNLSEALDTYQRVAEEWDRFGSVVEHAHALFGIYRCASALGHANEAAMARLDADSIVESLDAPLFTWILGPREDPSEQQPSAMDF